MKKGFSTPFSSFFPGRFFSFFAFFDSLARRPCGLHASLVKKLRCCAKLPTNRACGPVRRARRGVILNEKGVHHPFFKLFPQTFLLPLCPFQRSEARGMFHALFPCAAFRRSRLSAFSQGSATGAYTRPDCFSARPCGTPCPPLGWTSDAPRFTERQARLCGRDLLPATEKKYAF